MSCSVSHDLQGQEQLQRWARLVAREAVLTTAASRSMLPCNISRAAVSKFGVGTHHCRLQVCFSRSQLLQGWQAVDQVDRQVSTHSMLVYANPWKVIMGCTAAHTKWTPPPLLTQHHLHVVLGVRRSPSPAL